MRHLYTVGYEGYEGYGGVWQGTVGYGHGLTSVRRRGGGALLRLAVGVADGNHEDPPLLKADRRLCGVALLKRPLPSLPAGVLVGVLRLCQPAAVAGDVLRRVVRRYLLQGREAAARISIVRCPVD